MGHLRLDEKVIGPIETRSIDLWAIWVYLLKAALDYLKTNLQLFKKIAKHTSGGITPNSLPN